MNHANYSIGPTYPIISMPVHPCMEDYIVDTTSIIYLFNIIQSHHLLAVPRVSSLSTCN